MDNSLTVLWVLGVGVLLGLKARDWWERQPSHGHAYLEQDGEHAEESRTRMSLCRCRRCAPEFNQESPAEVQ